jgi:ferrous iron transport protein B
VPIVARTGEGLQALLAAVDGVSSGATETSPLRVTGTPEFEHAVRELMTQVEAAAPGVPNSRWLAIRLLDGDARVEEALRTGELARLVSRQQQRDARFSRQIALQGAQ